MRYPVIMLTLLLWMAAYQPATSQDLSVRYTDTANGFQFLHPASWKNDTPYAIRDRSGKIIATEVHFKDTSSGISFILTCHYTPAAQKLYTESRRQYKTHTGWYAAGAETILVDGQQALVAKTLLSTDGRGHLLPVPMRRMIVDFLSPNSNVEIQLQLSCTGTQQSESDLRALLSSFRFTHGHTQHKAGK